MRWAVLAGWLCIYGSALAANSGVGHSPEERLAQGQRLYHEGILPSGEPLRGLIHGDVEVTGKQAACARCHRRSGLGISEGGRLSLPITGAALYQAREIDYRELRHNTHSRQRLREAYDDRQLMRAIRQGVDPEERALDPLMPRYRLDDAEGAVLIAYLKSLPSSSALAPGVDDTSIHFATVFTPQATARQREAVLSVFETFLRDKNAKTRHEQRRGAHPPWHKDRHYKAYREWKLHVWQLQGSPGTWGDQLARLYSRQAVFAVLGGAGSGSWAPISRFCEEQALPCLFPTTDLPRLAGESFYTIYFSEGMYLEARAVAADLGRQDHALGTSVVQLYSPRPESVAAMRELQDALKAHRATTLDSIPIDRTSLQGLGELSRSQADVLVLWLNPRQLREMDVFAHIPASTRRIYVSSSLVGQQTVPRPSGGARLFQVHGFALPGPPASLLPRFTPWARAKGIDLSEPRLRGNTYFVVTLASDLIKHIAFNFSREYFIEKAEHMIDSVVTTSVYPHLSLAPHQRFASKGCYLLEMLPEPGEPYRVVRDWFVP